MAYTQNYPKCNKSDCFACNWGVCVALSDNNFGDKPCPFYKTDRENQLSIEQARYNRRQHSLYEWSELLRQTRLDVATQKREYIGTRH